MNPEFKDHNLGLDLDKSPGLKKDPYAEIPIKDFSYAHLPEKYPRKSKKSPKTKYYVLVLVVIVVVGTVGYLLLNSNSKDSKPVKSSKSTSSKLATKSNASTAPVASTTNYSSTNFNLTMNYPNNWVVSDTPTILQLTSPVTNIVNDKKQLVKGKIILNITAQGKLPSTLGNQSATAVLNSQLISYVSPTPAQDAQTYVSFLQYSSTNTVGGLDGIYITGNYGYLKSQTIPLTNLSSISPLVWITFQKCNNSKCTSLSNLTISSTDWQNTKFSIPIIDIIKSFQFS